MSLVKSGAFLLCVLGLVAVGGLAEAGVIAKTTIYPLSSLLGLAMRECWNGI